MLLPIFPLNILSRLQGWLLPTQRPRILASPTKASVGRNRRRKVLQSSACIGQGNFRSLSLRQQKNRNVIGNAGIFTDAYFRDFRKRNPKALSCKGGMESPRHADIKRLVTTPSCCSFGLLKVLPSQRVKPFGKLFWVFERYVNSKDNQTEYHIVIADDVFERYVNSKDNQTLISPPRSRSSLRDM